MRLFGLLPLLLALSLTAACVPAAEEVDFSRAYGADSVMGQIQERGHMLVAIADDAFPLGYVDENDQAQGFTAELARFIAEQLGVETRFLTGTSEQILELPKDDVVDIAFPAVPMTEPLVRKYQLTDPYYVSHQRLLVRTGEGDDELDTYCAFGHEHTLVNPNDPAATTVFDEPLECLRLLLRDRVDAVTGPDFMLAGLQLSQPNRVEVVGDQLTTEALGAVIERRMPTWTEYVNGVLALAEQEGVWQRAFDETLGGPLELEGEPPTITAEEAAALYPAESL